MAAGEWSKIGELSRPVLRASPRLQEAMLFLAIAEDHGGSEARADRLWARLERVTRENINRGNSRAQQWHYLGWALFGQGHVDGAGAAWRDLVRTMGPDENQYNRVCYLALAGETEAAMAEWENLTEAPGGFDLRWARVDPDLNGLRDDPRFEAARLRGIRWQRERQRVEPEAEAEIAI